MEKSCKRNANIVTETRCHFAVLDLVDYNRVLKKVESKIVQNQATFLTKIPFYRHMSFN